MLSGADRVTIVTDSGQNGTRNDTKAPKTSISFQQLCQLLIFPTWEKKFPSVGKKYSQLGNENTNATLTNER
jgi:hypothetical protein